MCDGANCWLTLTMWRGKPKILFSKAHSAAPVAPPYSIDSSLYSSPLPSGDTVVMMYIILCALSCLRVFYTIFLIVSFQPAYFGACRYFSTFMFLGTLSESELTKISCAWWDSAKSPCPSCPRDDVQPVLIARSVKCSVTTVGLELVEWVCNSNKIVGGGRVKKFTVKHKLKNDSGWKSCYF